MIRISTTVTNITPIRPGYMAGHAMRAEKHKGVHDEIEIVIIWLEVNAKKCLFVNADLSNFDYEFIHEAKRNLCEKFEVEWNNIVVSVGHTHSGPLFLTRDEKYPHDPEYRVLVMNRLLEGAASIYDKLQQVSKVTLRRGEVYGYYGNRNSKQKLGDQNVYVIEFKDNSGKNLAAMVNLSCHSTVLSPEDYNLSGDLFGAVRRKLTPVLDVVPMMMNGNAGDMSNRLYRQNNDFNELERTSTGIVCEIKKFDAPVEINIDDVKTSTLVFEVKYDTDKELLSKRLAASEKKLETETEYDTKKWLISEISSFKRKLLVDKVEVKIEATVMRLGELELVIIPGELVSAFGLQIKRSSTAKCCIVWGYANGQSGYIVEASEFSSGHDGISTQFPKGKAEEFVGLLIQKLF